MRNLSIKSKLCTRTRQGKLGKELYITDITKGGYTGFFKDIPKIVVEADNVEEAREKLWNAVFDILKHTTETNAIKNNKWQEKRIEKVAQKFVDGVNEAEGRKDNIDTLFNFGSMGLRTPREIATIFFNAFKEEELI